MTSRGRPARPALAAAGAAVLLLASCAGRRGVAAAPAWSPALAGLRLDGSAGSVDTVAPGVLHRAFLVRHGPWAVHVLDVDRDRCWTVVALKGTDGAAGRTRTSDLARLAAVSGSVAGAVNADFFLFDPPGVPTGAHVADGAVVTGPGARPVFAIDSAGRPWIGTLRAGGWATAAADSVVVGAWNRASTGAVAWFDARYGAAVDAATGSLRIALGPAGRVAVIDSGAGPMGIPREGGVLVAGRDVPAAQRAALLRAARSGEPVVVRVALAPLHPREAVGGFPVLVRDSAEVPALDSAGSASFGPVRHPRTIVGVAAGGRRLLLVTIDGRQPGHSAGTTLRESAQVLLALGATAALNLDGGGSTAMAVVRREGERRRVELVNRPSDPQGERAVGNALVVVCRAPSRP